MKRRRSNSQSGSALVQAMVGLAVLSIASYAFMGALSTYQNLGKDTAVINSQEREVNEIIENIRAGIENYQVSYTKQSDINNILQVSNLPMAWDVGIQTDRESCPNCAGFFGFVIQPLEGYKGLFLVTVRLTHKSWGDSYKEYQFTVTTK